MSNRNVGESSIGVVARILTWYLVDVAVIVGFLVAANYVFVILDPSSTPVRVLFGLPLLLFLPGYVLVTAAFPRASPPENRSHVANSGGILRQSSHLDGAERTALSFGLSVALLPLFGLSIAVSRWSFGTDVVVIGLSTFILLGGAVSILRGASVPSDARFRIPFRTWTVRLRRFLIGSGRRNTLVNGLLILSILLSFSVAGFAFAMPQDGEQYSEFVLLTETQDGEYVAGDYPEQLTAGQEYELVASVTNREQRQTQYTVVARMERFDSGADGLTVEKATELRRTRVTLEAGEQRRLEHTVSPEMVGETLRLSYYLYKGDAPEAANENSAYRHLYVWVEVTEGSEN